MKNLLIKEIKLFCHPTAILFLGLSAMILIPNYPYCTIFFYTSLGIFFCFLSGRENNDIYYTLSLPVRKKDVVNARFSFVVGLEVIQVILVSLFIYLRGVLKMGENQAGMDANIAMLGTNLFVVGIFNYVFTTKFYSDPSKVGKSFAFSTIVFWLISLIFEAFTFFVPLFEKLDTQKGQYQSLKLGAFVIGLIAYVVLTLAAKQKSIKLFETKDI